MKRVLRTATLVMIGLLAAPLAVAAEMQSFWDLKPQQLRVLVAAPQVMVTRTASGLDAYCRCPVVLKPHEIPEAMKKAIIAVEDKRFMDHGGIDLIALGSVLRGGLSRGGSTTTRFTPTARWATVRPVSSSPDQPQRACPGIKGQQHLPTLHPFGERDRDC